MKPSKGYKVIYIDIMVDGRFYRQMPYQYNPLWKLDVADVKKKGVEYLPESLQQKI